MFRHQLGEFRKRFGVYGSEFGCKSVNGESLRDWAQNKEYMYKLPRSGASNPGSTRESPKLLLKKISKAFPSPPPLSENGAQAFAVAKSSILMHSEGGENTQGIDNVKVFF